MKFLAEIQSYFKSRLRRALVLALIFGAIAILGIFFYRDFLKNPEMNPNSRAQLIDTATLPLNSSSQRVLQILKKSAENTEPPEAASAIQKCLGVDGQRVSQFLNFNWSDSDKIQVEQMNLHFTKGGTEYRLMVLNSDQFPNDENVRLFQVANDGFPDLLPLFPAWTEMTLAEIIADIETSGQLTRMQRRLSVETTDGLRLQLEHENERVLELTLRQTQAYSPAQAACSRPAADQPLQCTCLSEFSN